MNHLEVNAVFEGGGVKGIGLVGALKRVEDEGVLVRGVAGTSAGALVAALYAAGYTADGMHKLLMETDFSRLLDPSWPKSVDLWRHFGFYKGQKFYQWVRERLQEKGLVKFSDLGARDLKIVASNLTDRELVVFQKSSHPELEVAEAVRMSIGIPFFFYGYRWGEKLFVDGGLLSNYPLSVFEGSELPTLGFKLVSDERPRTPVAPTSLPGFVGSLVATVLEAHDKWDEKNLQSAATIHIPTDYVGTTDFALTPFTKEFLYQSGYVAASKFIRQSELFRPAAAAPAPAVPPPAPTVSPTAPAAAAPATAPTPAVTFAPNLRIYESLERAQLAAPGIEETAFQASRIQRTIRVLRPDAVMQARESLVNVSNAPRGEVIRPVYSDSRADFNQLGFKAWFQPQGAGEREAAVDGTTQDHRSFRVRIGFRGRLIEPGTHLDLRWSVRLPGSVPQREDYWFYFVNLYHHPVGRLIAEAIFGEDLDDIEFFVLTGTDLEPLRLDGPEPVPQDDGSAFHLYRAKVDGPEGLYLLRWRFRA